MVAPLCPGCLIASLESAQDIWQAIIEEKDIAGRRLLAPNYLAQRFDFCLLFSVHMAFLKRNARRAKDGQDRRGVFRCYNVCGKRNRQKKLGHTWIELVILEPGG